MNAFLLELPSFLVLMILMITSYRCIFLFYSIQPYGLHHKCDKQLNNGASYHEMEEMNSFYNIMVNRNKSNKCK